MPSRAGDDLLETGVRMRTFSHRYVYGLIIAGLGVSFVTGAVWRGGAAAHISLEDDAQASFGPTSIAAHASLSQSTDEKSI